MISKEAVAVLTGNWVIMIFKITGGWAEFLASWVGHDWLWLAPGDPRLSKDVGRAFAALERLFGKFRKGLSNSPVILKKLPLFHSFYPIVRVLTLY